MTEIRVLVVDDSAVVRRVLGDIISNEPGMMLVGTAKDGVDALKRIKELEPDLITLDLEMPIMGGLDVLAKLRLERSRIPVIVVSSLTRKGSAATLEALARGAADYVPKPTSSGDPRTPRSDIQAELVPRIRALASRRRPSAVSRSATRSASAISPSADARRSGSTPQAKSPRERTRPMTRPERALARTRSSRPESKSAERSTAALDRSRRRGERPTVGEGATGRSSASQRVPGALARGGPGILSPKAVVIGSSTGGPAALETVFSSIRSPLNVPMFIVQHIPAEFSAMLAKRLDSASAMTVVEASSGQVPEPGTVYLAPGGRHMVLTKNKRRVMIELTDTPPVNSCRPAVDVLFESSADVYGPNQLAVILTGMGHDGLDGCKKLFPLGVPILAQDEETCVVWGMPRFVTEQGLTDEVLPLGEIAGRIVARVSGRASTRPAPASSRTVTG